jgi:hypothetical protein
VGGCEQAVGRIRGKEGTPVYITLLRARERDVKLLRAAARSGQIKAKDGQLDDSGMLQHVREVCAQQQQEAVVRRDGAAEGTEDGSPLAVSKRRSGEHTGALGASAEVASPPLYTSSDDTEASPRLILDTYTSPQSSVHMSPGKHPEDRAVSPLALTPPMGTHTHAQSKDSTNTAIVLKHAEAAQAHNKSPALLPLQRPDEAAGQPPPRSGPLSGLAAQVVAEDAGSGTQTVRVRLVEARGIGTVVGLSGVMGVYCCVSLLAGPPPPSAAHLPAHASKQDKVCCWVPCVLCFVSSLAIFLCHCAFEMSCAQVAVYTVLSSKVKPVHSTV